MAFIRRRSRRSWLIGSAAVLLVSLGLQAGPSRPPPGPRTAAGPAVDPISVVNQRENPLEMSKWFALDRMTPDGRLPVINYLGVGYRARAMLREARLAARLGQIAPGAFSRPWTALGPADEGGRTRGLVINPRDPNVMYTGGVAGGVFKSTDAGATWRPVTEVLGNVSVGSIAMDPTNPDVLYAGTGELLATGYQDVTSGIGILKTTTAGRTWRLLPTTIAFGTVRDIVVSANDPRVVYAATEAGVMRSQDGGDAWTPSFSGSADGCTDLALRTDVNPDTVFAACALRSAGGIHRSADGGNQWEPVITDVEGQPAGNTVLAIAQSNQNIVYASVGSIAGLGENQAIALLRSDQGGANGTWVVANTADDTPGNPRYLASCGASGQAFWGNALAVDPTDPEHLWVAGVDAFRSDDGGRTLTIAGYWELRQLHTMEDGTPYIHADYHAIVFHPNYDRESNQTVYFATDAGVFRTQNDRAPLNDPRCYPTEAIPSDLNVLNDVTFDALNDGYSALQFYAGTVSDDGRYLLGGSQDNGTWGLDREGGGGPNDWIMVQGGDGFETAISPNNDAFYMEYYSGALTRVSQLTVSQGYREERLYQRLPFPAGRFHTPFVLDPNNSNNFWMGRQELVRSTDAAATFAEAGRFSVLQGISAIAVAPGNSDVVYVGTDAGAVSVSTNATATLPVTWTDISAGLPDGVVSSIAIHPTDPRTAYVTFSNFGIQKVWKTTDQGATWTNLDGILPDVPMNTVAINPLNPEMVYVGSDSGVYESPNGGTTWLPASGRLISTIVMRLVFRKGTSELYAFTHGRGAFLVDVGTGV